MPPDQTPGQSARESEIATNFQKADALRQAILKKALVGELVPQDPADEPASVLLERIRAERAAATKSNGTPRVPSGRKNHVFSASRLD